MHEWNDGYMALWIDGFILDFKVFRVIYGVSIRKVECLGSHNGGHLGFRVFRVIHVGCALLY